MHDPAHNEHPIDFGGPRRDLHFQHARIRKMWRAALRQIIPAKRQDGLVQWADSHDCITVCGVACVDIGLIAQTVADGRIARVHAYLAVSGCPSS